MFETGIADVISSCKCQKIKLCIKSDFFIHLKLELQMTKIIKKYIFNM